MRIAIATLLLASSLHSQQETEFEWLTDPAAATSRAAKEGKPLLFAFR